MNHRNRRALIAGSCLLAAAFALRLAPAARAMVAALRERAAVRTRAVEDARRILDRQDETRDSLQVALRSLVALAPAFVAGGTDADAGAALASALHGLAARHALRVTHLGTVSDSTPGAIRSTGARIELEGDVRGLTALLRAIESGEPLLTVRAMTVSAPDPGASSRTMERLRIMLVVTGWFVVREES